MLSNRSGTGTSCLFKHAQLSLRAVFGGARECMGVEWIVVDLLCAHHRLMHLGDAGDSKHKE